MAVNMQQLWEQEKTFEVQAPASGENVQKFFGNFPYPYMNGLLHLGHAFSLSKLEFASAFHRVCGRPVLFAQGFHCTGMPIKACADKLAREIEQYGVDAPVCLPSAVAQVEPGGAPAASNEAQPGGRHVGKKSKAAAKQGTAKTQWGILASSGIEGIERFSDSMQWLRYFPPEGIKDISAMGCGVDWRRTFITTDRNPYYDSFVQWQFRRLRDQGRIVQDKRYAVYSPKDGQPCADHDRASGEGSNPQEYTLVKMKVVEPINKLAELKGQGDIFFLAATLRPETMYGQLNCWVLPKGVYGAFRGPHSAIYVMAHRSARNLSWQDKMPKQGEPECLLQVSGQDLLGTQLQAPLSGGRIIYTLPLTTIKMDKGTGVVTSVPSDSPDDYIALKDLRDKPTHGVKPEWVPAEDQIIPVLETKEYGNLAAPLMCRRLGVKNQHDAKKLEEAKHEVYLKGFNDGVMIIGSYKGKKVSEVKGRIKQEMTEAGEALNYAEPERPVMSRSGDDCVVALTDQWYLTYGEEGWKRRTEQCLQQMHTYTDDTRHGFEYALGWLNQWACSRSFGLGTRLPCDPTYLIESLSDSTIYMAYYTVAHLLQQGNLFGEGTGGIRPQDMTDEVWNFIFLKGFKPEVSAIPGSTLEEMRREFEFWYPFDVRVSGKDLINNHLTFCLYNHTAIWEDDPSKWPRAMRCNGHLLLNGDKMSKSTGNFKTLRQAIDEYGADAMRIALADAGDGMEDANFEVSVANAAVLRLTKELAWMEDTARAEQQLRDGGAETFADRAFNNSIHAAVQTTHAAMDAMLFKEALKHSFFGLLNARNLYLQRCGKRGMRRDLARRYMEVYTQMMVPFCPHWSEHVWRNVLHCKGSVWHAGWPKAEQPDLILQATKAQVTVVPRFDGWQAEVLQHMQKVFNSRGQPSFPRDLPDQLTAQVLQLKLPFDEAALVQENQEYLCHALGLEAIHVVTDQAQSHQARPAQPLITCS
eukprot:jgi/Astpho2/6901/fgenesh1_pm.00106_%23_9_t